VRQVLDEWLEEHATIARPGAHVLRHTCLTGWVRRGTDLVTVAELAGHSRVETRGATACPAKPTASKPSTGSSGGLSTTIAQPDTRGLLVVLISGPVVVVAP
jgi:hypothetical protein